MSGTKITKGELQDRASEFGVDPYQPYEELCEALDDEIETCKICSDEFIGDMWGGCCSDTCQIEHHHERGWA